jgi:hypothetical protein
LNLLGLPSVRQQSRRTTVTLSDGKTGYLERPGRADDCLAACLATCLHVPIREVPDPRLDERVAAGESVQEINRSALLALAKSSLTRLSSTRRSRQVQIFDARDVRFQISYHKRQRKEVNGCGLTFVANAQQTVISNSRLRVVGYEVRSAELAPGGRSASVSKARREPAALMLSDTSSFAASGRVCGLPCPIRGVVGMVRADRSGCWPRWPDPGWRG